MSIKNIVAALTVALGVGVGAATGAASASAAPIASPPASLHLEPAPETLMAPLPANWLGDTGQFAFCLGGFGVAAAPIVGGFMFGGPAGAVKAGKEWIGHLGPVGGATVKACMWSVLHVRV